MVSIRCNRILCHLVLVLVKISKGERKSKYMRSRHSAEALKASTLCHLFTIIDIIQII